MARFNGTGNARDPENVDLAAQILAKHSRSSQPESKQICVVLGAVTEVLKDEGYSPTPTAYFAAIMSLLEKPETKESPQVCAAMCNILATVLARAPKAALRSKFAASSQILTIVAEQHLDEAGVMKALVTCLGQVVAAVDPSHWPSAVRPFSLLLQLLLDERPKVRKRAQDAAHSVLVSLRDTPARQPASDAVLKMSQRVLPGPEAGARMAAQASGKQRKELETKIAKATADALHLLGWLRMALPLLPGAIAQEIAGLVVRLYSHRHPLLSRCATDALTGLCSASSSLPAPALVELLRVVAQSESAWEVKDQSALVSLIDLIESACMRLQEVDRGLAGERLPGAFHALVPLLQAESEGVRFATEQALKRLLATCFTPELVAAAATQLKSGRAGPPPAAAAVVASVCSALADSTPQAWPNALSVSSSLLERLGSRGAAVAQPLVLRVGALCAEAAGAEAGREEGEEAEPFESAAAATMGAAIRHTGPPKILEALPLNIVEELEGRAKARTWLLPMLRQHARGTQLLSWCQALLPLARKMGALAAAGGNSVRGMQCRALEGQLWACLPAFASYPTDLPEAFRAHARDIGSAFQNREDLRPPICAALIRMCTQSRRMLQATGEAQSMGLAGRMANADSDDEDEEKLAGSGAAPSFYTADMAKRNVEALQAFSKNWLPLLSTAFLGTDTGQRGPLCSTIAAYAAISEQSLLTSLFHTALKKFLKVTQDALAEVPAADALTEGGDNLSEQRCTFLELALALAGSLDTAAIGMLYKAIKPALQERDQAVQKRAYKILAFICAARQDFAAPHLAEVLAMLLSGVTSSLSAAKRHRLRCLQAVVLLLMAPDAPEVDLSGTGEGDTASMSTDEHRKQVVASLVGEIVLCVKEVNQKTRAAAYGLLVELGQAMQDAAPPAMPDLDAHTAGMELQGNASDKGGLALLFEMVLGGLVGTSPHMISASVMALARLLHQFANELGGVAPALLPAVLMLLRTKSREVVKSVLGFVKVCAMRLPADVLEQHLQLILEGLLLWSEDSKNKFKLKVRVIVERLARRCGYDAVAAAMPAGDRRLLSHIQKEMLRKRRTQTKPGSEVDAESEPEARTVFTKQGATTAGWNHSRVFSEAASGGPTLRTAGKQSARTRRQGAAAASRAATQLTSAKHERLRASDSGDPVDILDASAASRAPRRPTAERRSADAGDFARNSEGRMIFREEDTPKGPKPKRRPGGGFDDRASDDSDFDDLRQIGGFRRGMQSASAKSVALANTVATKAKTARTSRTGVDSMAGHSSIAGRSKDGAKGRSHSGDRFKAKSKSGGDVKGSSKVEPYAYWPLDRKMLNRRSAKQTTAKRGLDQVVNAVKVGAGKGRKAKRQRTL